MYHVYSICILSVLTNLSVIVCCNSILNGLVYFIAVLYICLIYVILYTEKRLKVPMKRYFSRQKAIFVLTEKDRLKPTTKSRKKNFWSKGSYNRLELCDLPDFCTCLFSDSRACALRRNYM